ncbi:unnamed protein product [Prunus armeniaca]
MMKELRQIIEANPVFRGKLKYPSIKSQRLHRLINQRCALREQYLSMLQRAQVKSTVTDPGQSHLSTVAIPNLEPGGVGDIGLWDVSSGKKLLSRNFRVLNLDAGPMALKSPDGSIFGENVLVLKWYGVADFHFL